MDNYCVKIPILAVLKCFVRETFGDPRLTCYVCGWSNKNHKRERVTHDVLQAFVRDNYSYSIKHVELRRRNTLGHLHTLQILVSK